MDRYPGIGELVRRAQQRLSGLAGLHLTPADRLHVTVQRIGPAGPIPPGELLAAARRTAGGVPPARVTVERVLYHPEAVALAVRPGTALLPVWELACSATRAVLGDDAPPPEAWTPHLTIAYSVSDQRAATVIGALGRSVPAHEITVTALDLVVQWGPERDWRWQTLGTVPLGAR